MNQSRKQGRYVKITSFQTIRRGNWKLKFSTTDYDSIMILCQSAHDMNLCFVKFFSTEEEAISFIDFLVTQDTYLLDKDGV